MVFFLSRKTTFTQASLFIFGWSLYVPALTRRNMLKVGFTNYRLDTKCSFRYYFNPLDLSINAFASSIFDSIEVAEDFFLFGWM